MSIGCFTHICETIATAATKETTDVTSFDQILTKEMLEFAETTA